MPRWLETCHARTSIGRRMLQRKCLSPMNAVIARIVTRSAEAQLQRLDDRMLKDIGLNRSEIASALRDRSGERRRGSLRA